MRVEWSNNNQNKEKRIDAQPHWHIHSFSNSILEPFKNISIQDQKIFAELLNDIAPSRNKPIMEEEGTEVVEEKEVNPITASKEFPLFRFHLAMLAEWEMKDGKPHNKELTPAKLELWLPQCLNYIREQFEYILEKSGK